MPDVAIGYVLSLKFYPSASAAAVNVTDANGSTDIAVARDAVQAGAGNRLSLDIGLENLRCSATNTLCADGKYELTAFAAASYWDNAGQPLANLDAWKANARRVVAAPLPTLSSAIFFVGEAPPSGAAGPQGHCSGTLCAQHCALITPS